MTVLHPFPLTPTLARLVDGMPAFCWNLSRIVESSSGEIPSTAQPQVPGWSSIALDLTDATLQTLTISRPVSSNASYRPSKSSAMARAERVSSPPDMPSHSVRASCPTRCGSRFTHCSRVPALIVWSKRARTRPYSSALWRYLSPSSWRLEKWPRLSRNGRSSVADLASALTTSASSSRNSFSHGVEAASL